MKKYTLVLADDHQLFLDGMSSLLQTDPLFEVLAKFTKGQELIDYFSEGSELPQAVVLDINIPDLDGVEIARELKRLYPSVSILIVSMNSHISLIRKLLGIGVDGYILKENSRAELINALHALVAGRQYFSQNITQVLTNSLSNNGQQQVSLTKREYEVLQWVAKGLTTASIADKLFVSASTVVTHRKNIMQKLDVKNVAEMIRYATEMGMLE